MARSREFGPIPLSIFLWQIYLDLDDAAARLFLELLATCSYRGRFPLAPRVLAPTLGRLDPDSLVRPLGVLLDVGFIEGWASEHELVGQIRGYDKFCPKRRISKRPQTPEFDDIGPKTKVIRRFPELVAQLPAPIRQSFELDRHPSDVSETLVQPSASPDSSPHPSGSDAAAAAPAHTREEGDEHPDPYADLTPIPEPYRADARRWLDAMGRLGRFDSPTQGSDIVGRLGELCRGLDERCDGDGPEWWRCAVEKHRAKGPWRNPVRVLAGFVLALKPAEVERWRATRRPGWDRRGPPPDERPTAGDAPDPVWDEVDRRMSGKYGESWANGRGATERLAEAEAVEASVRAEAGEASHG